MKNITWLIFHRSFSNWKSYFLWTRFNEANFPVQTWSWLLQLMNRVTSLAMEQLYDCPSTTEITLKDVGKIDRCESVISKDMGKTLTNHISQQNHDDVIKWKHFTCYWPFVLGIHRSPVTSPHKGQWRGALIISLICVWINVWENNSEAGDLRRHRAHYDITVMNREASI